MHLDQLTMEVPRTETEIAKSQKVRLLDIAVFGPLMIHIGLGKKPPQVLKTALLLVGIGTIVYNGANYFRNLDKGSAQVK